MPLALALKLATSVSAFLCRYRRDVLGMDEAQAREAMETIWRPGGVWAALIGGTAAVALPHRFKSA
jgi:hypothetical protein